MNKHSIAAIILGSLSGLAYAGDATVIPFNDLDVNQDDALSADEAGSLPGITEQWTALDADGNNQLSRGEYATYSIPAPASGSIPAPAMDVEVK